MKIAATNKIYNIDGETIVNKAYVGADLVWFREPIRVWNAYFDESFWFGTDGVLWDGVKWNSGYYNNLYLIDVEPWVSGFRPTKCRVSSGSPTISNVCVYSALGEFIGIFLDWDGVSVAEMDLAFTDGSDIHSILVAPPPPGVPHSITNIEFFH